MHFGDDWLDEEVFVVLTERDRGRIDTLLAGWDALQGQPGGFEELMARLEKQGFPLPW